MGETTAIGWTDHTFNPWWGCERVSPGCQHCYAETFAKRTGNDVWGRTAPRRFFGPKHWAEPERWNAAALRDGLPAFVFCASMADVFEDRRDLDGERARLFELIERTPGLLWQLLTKRPEHVLRLVPEHWRDGFPPNAWIGTTVEDQRRADERIPELVRIPAAVRFLSCEPLLEPIDFPPGRFGGVEGIDWVIVGGESGPGHRPLDPYAAAHVCAQVRRARVPLFFKQWGGRTPTAGGDEIDLDGTGPRQWKQFPPRCEHLSLSGLDEDRWRCDVCRLILRRVDVPGGFVRYEVAE